MIPIYKLVLFALFFALGIVGGMTWFVWMGNLLARDRIFLAFVVLGCGIFLGVLVISLFVTFVLAG